MKTCILFILFATLMSTTIKAQQVPSNLYEKVYKKAMVSKPKHQIQNAQQQQQMQNIQNNANNAVTQSQQTANQMANTDHTELLKQTGSVRPTQISGGANLSKVKNKVTYGGKDGNTVTQITSDNNVPNNGANNSPNAGSSDNQATNSQESDVAFNIPGNNHATYKDNVKVFKPISDFSSEANNKEAKRPPRNAGIGTGTKTNTVEDSIKGHFKPDAPGLPYLAPEVLQGCMDVKLPKGYLPLGKPGTIFEARGTYDYLMKNQDLANPCAKLYCMSKLVNDMYVVNVGVPGKVPGTCRYIQTAKPRSKTAPTSPNNPQNKTTTPKTTQKKSTEPKTTQKKSK